jgi:Holliday junction resolvase RusA-like endonuclease
MQMNKIEFTVPGQPVGKGRARIGRAGKHARMFTPEKTVSYESLVAMFAHQAMNGAALFECAVAVVMEVELSIPVSWSNKKKQQAVSGEIKPTTKPDADNVIKAVFDALNGVVWRDDSQVTGLLMAKSYSEAPCVNVLVQVAQ